MSSDKVMNPMDDIPALGLESFELEELDLLSELEPESALVDEDSELDSFDLSELESDAASELASSDWSAGSEESF